MIKLTEKQLLCIKDYMKSQYPKEGVVAVVDNDLVFLENISKTPELDFKVDFYSENLQALIHSHPNGTTEFTQMDMTGQINTNIPWGVMSVNCYSGVLSVSEIEWLHNNITLHTPLLGRSFKHGIFDCYSAIRAFYAQSGEQIAKNFEHCGKDCRTYLVNKQEIIIKEFPRDGLWWERGDDLYSNGFSEAGFKVVNFDDLKVGDVVLYKIKSSVLNHGAVFLGDGMIYHHLYNRLSVRETFGHWSKFANLYLRYVA